MVVFYVIAGYYSFRSCNIGCITASYCNAILIPLLIQLDCTLINRGVFGHIPIEILACGYYIETYWGWRGAFGHIPIEILACAHPIETYYADASPYLPNGSVCWMFAPSVGRFYRINTFLLKYRLRRRLYVAPYCLWSRNIIGVLVGYCPLFSDIR